jgi:DNA-binding MarR family transcriptional regulator
MSAVRDRSEAVEVVATQLLPRASLVTRLLMRQADVARADAGILGALADGPMRITELATSQALAQPTVTQLVARLEEQGRVGREKHPDDGRVVLVSLTAAGRAALDDLRDAYRRSLREALAGRSDADVRALAKAADMLGELIAELQR